MQKNIQIRACKSDITLNKLSPDLKKLISNFNNELVDDIRLTLQ